MHNRWSDQEASACCERYANLPGVNNDVALRVYSSRLIGADSELVLHGGGNTSVKTQLPDQLGEPIEVLCVKGSGWNLARLEPQGLPAVRLQPLRSLRSLDQLGDEAMVNFVRGQMLDSHGPNPSTETLLHAFLAPKFIDHSHADVILAIVGQVQAEQMCEEVFGATLAVVPYVMPGFRLAKLAAQVHASHPDVEGLLLLHHGLFTFGDTARESYGRHIEAVERAAAFVRSRRYWRASRPPPLEARPEVDYTQLAPVLRGKLSAAARCPYTLVLRQSSALSHFLDEPRLAERCQRGVVTPDHVIRTKNLPLVLRLPRDANSAQYKDALASSLDERLQQYRIAYRGYFERQVAERMLGKTPLDPDPRVMLVPGLGMIAAGRNRRKSSVVADLYEHTVSVLHDADTVGEFAGLPEQDVFDMEYWSLEQAKLGERKTRPLEGRVVYITGAARGIGAATATAFAREGAQLFLVDKDADALPDLSGRLGCPYAVADVSDREAVRSSLERAVETYGGLDGAVSNAGTAPQGAIDTLDPELLRASFEVNLFAHQWVAAGVAAILRAQGLGGFLLFNASKSAFNPGPEFGPYSVAKAALVALMKQYALELGPIGVRVNAVNADRVRTELISEAEIAERAKARGLDSEAYFASNLLGKEVTAGHVASAFVALALSERTTGCAIPVDGGNIAASPR